MFRSLLVTLSLVASFSPIFTQAQSPEEIEVELATQTKLSPVYLSPFYLDDPDLGPYFLDQLEEIFLFDLNQTGFTQLIKLGEKGSALSSKEGYSGPFEREKWKNMGISYVFKVRIHKRNLYASIFSVADYNVRNIEGISLSGVIRDDRRKIHQLVDKFQTAFFGTEPVLSTRILFAKKTRDHENDSSSWISEIFECDFDGANPRQLTFEKNYCVTPTYIPPKVGYASGGFFYVSYRMGQPKIYMASLDEGLGKRFTTLRGNQLMPSISEDREQVVFVSDAGGNPDIFIQNYSTNSGGIGKPRQIFTAKRGTQASPVFNRDRSRVAFVSDKDGSPRIYVLDIPPVGMSLERIVPVLITKANRESTAPVWSPDGNMLAYSSMTNGVRQIWIYDFETQKEWQLTEGGNKHKENPSWASNSLHLVYNESDENSSELYIINLNQRKPTRITSGSGEKRFPCWEKRRL